MSRKSTRTKIQTDRYDWHSLVETEKGVWAFPLTHTQHGPPDPAMKDIDPIQVALKEATEVQWSHLKEYTDCSYYSFPKIWYLR